MPTIKTKKEMNLPQLIEWGFRNNIENKSYKTNDAEAYELYFDDCGTPRFSSFVIKHDTFTVEIEEEITEDTKLKEIFLITNNSVHSEKYYNYSINDVLTNNEGYYEELAILILEPEPLIIWTKEKGLVE